MWGWARDDESVELGWEEEKEESDIKCQYRLHVSLWSSLGFLLGMSPRGAKRKVLVFQW